MKFNKEAFANKIAADPGNAVKNNDFMSLLNATDNPCAWKKQ